MKRAKPNARHTWKVGDPCSLRHPYSGSRVTGVVLTLTPGGGAHVTLDSGETVMVLHTRDLTLTDAPRKRLTGFYDWRAQGACEVPGCGNADTHLHHVLIFPARGYAGRAPRRGHDLEEFAVTRICAWHHQDGPHAAHRMKQEDWAVTHWGSEANLFGLIAREVATWARGRALGEL
ncbi:hypothetical protein [Deinococcus kurensis]|uniref:hypothetical protein n=1 Tax=Deinococcus kurensis TaxID=2662757 RepID=UPI0012D2F9B2|nr:hypothetical protein [Deinococcus kurensis]